MAESSSAAPSPKPVVVRVKRKPSQSPLDAFWLEINERPLKRPLLDFGNLSISDSAQKVEFHNKKVFVQRVETISSSEVTFDTVQSFVDPGSSGASDSKSKFEERKNFFKRDNKQDQLLFKAKQEKESLAKDARFEQIWKSRKGNKGTAHDKALQEICHFYDIVRVDNEEKSKEVQQEEISLEDQRLLSSYLPLLREFIPNAAAEVEADLIAHLIGHSKEENYVYDLYTVKDEMDINVDDSSSSYPLVQVDEEEDYYDGPDDSDYESDDSNAENNPLNDYPDEISEEDEEVEDSESESEREHGDTSNESSDEDIEHHGVSKDDADPLYDEDFDEYEGVGNYDDEDVDDEDWRWSYR
ncbi:RNA-directed DNA methylation 4 [Spatholobus suberectus]|nr:RNA-directed DNA methylation 4 [Spatholobus suberectus]